MNELLRQSIIDGDANITISVNASDLREIVTEMVASERKRVAEEMERNKQKPTLTIEEVATMLGKSRSTLYRWEKSGYLTPVKIGCSVLYRRADIDEIMTKSEII